MSDREEKKVSENAFEDGLKHILSNESVDATGRPMAVPPPPKSAPATESAAREAAAERLRRMEEADQKMPLWVKILRPAAFVALAGLLIAFAYRFTQFGN
jgi:hypothetical protein